MPYITLLTLSLFLLSCSKSPSHLAPPSLLLVTPPKDIVLSPGQNKHFVASASTNSTEPVQYVWQKIGGATDMSVSVGASMDLGSSKACVPKTDAYRLIARSGALRAEKTFSITQSCEQSVGGVSDDGLRVTPADHVWIAPGQQVPLSAATSLPGATVKWEAITDSSVQVVSQNGQYTFTAPPLRYPCEESVYAFKATATQGGRTTSKTISINVENPTCTITEKDGLVSNEMTTLLIAKDGALFFGTRNGLSRFKNGQVMSTQTAGNNEMLQVVTTLAQSDSQIFVGKARKLVSGIPMRGFGVELLQIQNNAFYWSNTPLYTDSYVSLVYFNPNTQQMPEVLTAKNYTTSGAVHRSADLSFHSTADVLQGESMYAAVDYNDQTYFGGDGGIFVLRGNNLVQRFDGSQWNGKGGIFGIGSNRSVRAIAKDASDKIWIGLQAGHFEDGGLVMYEPATGQWTGPIKIPAGQDVRALVVDSNNNLWIATDNGLLLRRPDGVFKDFGSGFLPSSDIRALAYSPEQENLWIATSAGAARWSLPQIQ